MRLIIRCTICGAGFEPVGLDAFYPGERYSLDLPEHDAPCGLPCAGKGMAPDAEMHGTSCPRCGGDGDDDDTYAPRH